jgi:hypothetical protein
MVHLHPHLFFLPFIVAFGLVGTLITIVPYWIIFRKAGFSPWLAILMFLPLLNILLLYYIALAQWKVIPVAPVYPAGYPPNYPPPPAGPVYPG